MRKFLSLICVAIIAAGAHAQLVTSTSKSISTAKEQKSKVWILRAGIGTNNFVGDIEDASSKFGYFVGWEFNKQVGSGSSVGSAYWGMDIAFQSNGYKYEDEVFGYKYEKKMIVHSLQWSPFIFGYKFNVANNFSIDPHIGAYLMGDFAGKIKWTEEYEGMKWEDDYSIYDEDDYTFFDVGMKIGVGFWYKNAYGIDLTYQRGFVNVYDYDDYSCKRSNFMVRLSLAL